MKFNGELTEVLQQFGRSGRRRQTSGKFGFHVLLLWDETYRNHFSKTDDTAELARQKLVKAFVAKLQLHENQRLEPSLDPAQGICVIPPLPRRLPPFLHGPLPACL